MGCKWKDDYCTRRQAYVKAGDYIQGKGFPKCLCIYNRKDCLCGGEVKKRLFCWPYLLSYPAFLNRGQNLVDSFMLINTFIWTNLLLIAWNWNENNSSWILEAVWGAGEHITIKYTMSSIVLDRFEQLTWQKLSDTIRFQIRFSFTQWMIIGQSQ